MSKWFDAKVFVLIAPNNEVTYRSWWVIQIIHFIPVHCIYQSAALLSRLRML
jgi:hypothetical protein